MKIKESEVKNTFAYNLPRLLWRNIRFLLAKNLKKELLKRLMNELERKLIGKIYLKTKRRSKNNCNHLKHNISKQLKNHNLLRFRRKQSISSLIKNLFCRWLWIGCN